MVMDTCLRCGKKFSTSHYLKRHAANKTSCKINYVEVDMKSMLERYDEYLPVYEDMKRIEEESENELENESESNVSYDYESTLKNSQSSSQSNSQPASYEINYVSSQNAVPQNMVPTSVQQIRLEIPQNPQSQILRVKKYYEEIIQEIKEYYEERILDLEMKLHYKPLDNMKAVVKKIENYVGPVDKSVGERVFVVDVEKIKEFDTGLTLIPIYAIVVPPNSALAKAKYEGHTIEGIHTTEALLKYARAETMVQELADSTFNDREDISNEMSSDILQAQK